MIQVNFQEPDSSEWLEWKSRCREATEQLISDVKSGRTPMLTKLYKEQKTVLLDSNDNFYGKCAYCESLITSNQSGDIDHFRPKGRIANPDNTLVMIIDENGNQKPHPGYYWLAYEVSNLLPSCIDCNRPSRGNSGGNRVGKWDQFPLSGKHAVNPGEETNESPLLIHPVTENPEKHLEIDDLGILHPKNERGEKCIEIFGLNIRQSLVDERKRAYDNIMNTAKLLIIALVSKADGQPYIDEINAYKAGHRPFAIAGRKAFLDFKIENQRIISFLNQ